MVKVDTSEMDDATFRHVVVQHLNQYQIEYEAIERKRPSSLRARVIYWPLRVMGWLGMLICLLVGASFTLVAEEFWLPVWEAVDKESTDDLVRDGVLKTVLQDNEISSKNLRRDIIHEVIVHYNPYWQNAAVGQWLMVGPFVMFYLMSFLSRRIIRRSRHLFRLELLHYRYFEESRFTKSPQWQEPIDA